MEFHISLEQVGQFAKQFWTHVKDAKVFAFHGEMGAGKTTIISALCHYKGVADVTSSPTFSIINEYSFTDGGAEKKIYHIDLYRLKNEEEVIQAGVEECIYSSEICIVEWPEKAPNLFDEKTVHIFIETVSETERKVKVETGSEE